MTIYFNDTDNTTLEITPTDSSYRYREIMGENNLTIYFSLTEFVEIPINATCEFQGETYTLLRSEDFKKNGTRNFEYTIVMYSDVERFKRYKLRNTIDGRIKFSYVATPKEFIQLVVDNLNMRESGWSVGECIEATEQSISFSHNNCAEVLTTIADTFETEYEVVGKVIHLHKVEYNKDNPLPLSYGKGNGFKPGTGRSNYDDSFPVEILYVEGGSDNIDASTYGSSELLLPISQTYEYEGRTYVTDELGLSIRRADKDIVYNNEDSLDCTHIYPSRTGEVTGVVVVDEDENWYDIIDSTIPDALDFSQQLIAGETPTIIFQTGMLATREFGIETNDDGDLTGYDPDTKKFQIVPEEYSGIMMPSETYKPAIGDTYVVFGVSLPDAYICDNDTQTGASWDMFKEACKYMYENEDPCFTFSGELDGIYAKKNWLDIGGRIVLGGYVDFSDTQFEGAEVRIMNINEYINKPYSPVLDLSNSTVGSLVGSELKKIEANEVVVEDNYKSSIQYTKRTIRDAVNTIEMLTDAKLTNFTESINPLTVWTMQLIAGDESLQFAFLDEKGEEIALNATYDSSTQIFTVPTHTLRHETLGIEYISSEVADEDKLRWTVQSYTSPALTERAEGYYLYAKCAKAETANTANVFLLSDTGIGMEEVDGYYHFLVGILNPESEGGRSFAEMYGYTEILPGQIRTNKVVSNDGQSYFDMLNDALKLGSKLQYNIDGTGELRIIGTIVQSLSGAESYLGTYRGEYSSLVKYYQGDSVSYTVDNITSTYQYINATATTGVLPTNTTYWALTASGGSDGDSVAILSTTVTYAQSTSGETPPTDGWSESIPAMTSGNYLWTRTIIDYSTGDDTTSYSVARWGIDGDSITIVSTSIMYNRHTSGTLTPKDTWTSTIPEVGEGEYLWTRTIVTYSDGVSTTTYSVSRQGEDGDSVTIESTTVTYAQSTSGTTAPTTGWSSTVPTMTAGNYLWTRIVVDYSTGDDTTSYSVTRWGVDGSDGTDYEWIFTRTTGSTTPTTPSTSQKDDYVPSSWTDDMQGVTSVYQYEWASKRSKVNGVWSVFSTPALWSKYAVDGDSITIVSTSIMYNRHTSGTVTPTDTWTSTIPEVGEGEYLWTRTIVTYSDGVSTTAYSVSRQGVDGVGTNGRGIDSITNYYLASSLSSGVSTSTSGWTTAVQTASSTKPYLWNYERIYFDDGTYSNTTPSIIGNYASDGAAGKGISTIVEYYAINDSTTAPASGWTTSVQTPTSTDRYLWNYEVITYTDNTSTTTSKRIIGVYGETGADGVGVYQIYKRAKSQPSTPSGTAYPPEGWSTSTDSASVLVYAISFSTSWTPSSSSYNTFGSYFEFCDYEGKNTSSVATVDTKFYKFKDGVDNTTIPSYAFRGTTSFYGMTSIEIPDTVTSIGSNAFYYQQGLTEVIFPPSVVSLSTYAFRYCTGLESVRFYGDVATISSGAFSQSGLIKVELLNVTSVPTLGSSYSIPNSTNLAIYVPSSLVESFSSASYWSSLASYLVSSDTGYENDYEPTISLSWLLWASIANITDGSIASWGAPYQLQGADGADGAQGPIQIFRGEYDYSTIYYGNSTRVDIVKYNSVYYMTKTTAGSFSGSIPSSTSTVWSAFGGSYESIATGLLFAEKAVVENLVVRELETSSGKVKIEDDGSITAEDAKITGSLTQPYKYLSSGESISSTDFTDNVIYYSSYGEILGNLPIGTENNGRLLRIIHGRNESGTLPEGWVQLGYYNSAGQANITFYERDASYSYLMISREIVELLGYGHTSTQGKWIVLNRTNVEPNHRYGLPMRILALGLVLVDNDAITSQTIASVDGRTFTVTRTGEGKYTVRVTDNGYWGDISTLMVACQAVDSSQRYVTVLNASETAFYKYWYLGGSDDESNNDTGFYIYIYSTLSINPNNIEI